ncbi:hypothetical protein OAH88_00215 [Candidatus Pelagibacter sp.]|jgi:hypothetical protein|nr:hypothetical protein [Candidatus Pelagibacter sp.]
MNIYSIKEIVKATNEFLDSDIKNETKKNLITKDKIPLDTKNLIIEAEKVLIEEKKNNQNINKPLVLRNEILSNNTVDQHNYKINIKTEAKDNIVDELYTYLKKKIKKNTLKLIIDQQLEIKNLKNKIIYLKLNAEKIKEDYQIFKENYAMLLYNNEILKIDNINIQNNLDQIIKDKELTDLENKELKLNSKKIKEELEESIKKNRSFEINSHELKNTISRYIVSYKKLQDEKKQIINSNETNINNDAKKVEFYQNENIRLSSELLNIQNKNKILKENLNNIELEKEKISNKIKELSSTIVGKSNVLPSTIIKEKPANKKEYIEAEKDINNQSEIDKKKLDDVINRIFAKI